jgi:arginine/lysine/ornithine decarboxylase
MASLDGVNVSLAGEYPIRLQSLVKEVKTLKSRLKKGGYTLVGSEPLKLTLKPKSYGYCGGELAKLLENAGVFPEFADSDYLVLMLTPENADSLDKIITALLSAERRQAIKDSAPDLCDCPYAISLREALFAESEIIKASQSLGRILAQFNIACPPAVPIAVCGERINEQALKCFEYYGIKEISVVKE